jgi:diguanylate cyclase (GGDEF)-like protein/PAS domain S-box-containing protein
MNEGRRRHAWFVVAIVSLTITLLLRFGGALGPIDWAVADLYSRLLRHEVPSDIVIVGIDERSLAGLHRWPWPRSTHARLLDQLLPMHPRHVFLDIDFSTRSTPQEDQQLADALSRSAPSTLILPAFQQNASSDADELLFTAPLPEFQLSATLGSVNLVPAADSLVRNIDTLWSPAGAHLPAVYALLSDRELPRGRLAIDYALSPRSFEFISYIDLLQGRIDAATLQGKTVMIGATAIELGDMQPVPVYRSLPGVIVQALAAQTARSGRLLVPRQSTTCALLALWALLVASVLRGNGWRANAAIAVASALFAMGATLAARYLHLQLEVVPLLAIVAVSFLFVTLRSLDAETLRALRLSIIANRREALLRSVVESSTECILCVDAEGRIVSANASAGTLLAGTPATLDGQTLGGIVPDLLGADHLVAMQTLRNRISEGTAHALDGTRVPIELSITPVPLKDEQLYIVLLRDLSVRKLQEQRLHHQAMHDALTGLPNRHAISLALQERMEEDAKAQRAFALFMLDLTRFKEVNDTLGHTFGDFVLREVARRFQVALGDRGTLARMGGDEFVILGRHGLQQAELRRLAHSLVDSLKTPVHLEGLAIEVGVNVGIACYPDDARDADELLKNADIAMYSAKRQSAVCIFYNAADNAHSVRSLAMLGDLRAALEHGALELHYQPQVNLQSGRAESVEALLRWEHPKYGAVSPLEVIPLAEASDLLRPLTDWTITAALTQARQWELAGQRTRIAINLSAHMLHDLSLPERLAQELAKHEVLPDVLEVEITESAMMLDVTRALTIVRSIHDLGVHVSVDDYGTGFSSLRYLRDLSIDTLKLDRSFVSDLETNADSRIIVESTVALAQALQLSTVAEGVSTAWQADFLRSRGCGFAQGYHYAKALPASECAQWMRSHNASVDAGIPQPEHAEAAQLA